MFFHTLALDAPKIPSSLLLLLPPSSSRPRSPPLIDKTRVPFSAPIVNRPGPAQPSASSEHRGGCTCSPSCAPVIRLGAIVMSCQRWELRSEGTPHNLHACYASVDVGRSRPQEKLESSGRRAGGQVVSRKPEVNLRLSWPEAD